MLGDRVSHYNSICQCLSPSLVSVGLCVCCRGSPGSSLGVPGPELLSCWVYLAPVARRDSSQCNSQKADQECKGTVVWGPLWHLHDMTGSHHLFRTLRSHCISWKCSEIPGTVGKPLMLWVALPRTGRVQPGLLGKTGVLTHCRSPRIGLRWLGHLEVDIDPGLWGWVHPWVKVTLLLAPEARPSQPALLGGSGPPASPVSLLSTMATGQCSMQVPYNCSWMGTTGPLPVARNNPHPGFSSRRGPNCQRVPDPFPAAADAARPLMRFSPVLAFHAWLCPLPSW